MIKPIVIIDDDREDLELAKEILVEMRIINEVFSFEDPREAIDFLQTSTVEPLCILSDINMPRINGFELRRQLLEMKSSCNKAPFIFLSTSKSDNECLLAEQLQIAAFYKKATSFNGMKETFLAINVLCKLSFQ
jgi:CheY-like chemotaxis protein